MCYKETLYNLISQKKIDSKDVENAAKDLPDQSLIHDGEVLHLFLCPLHKESSTPPDAQCTYYSESGLGEAHMYWIELATGFRKLLGTAPISQYIIDAAKMVNSPSGKRTATMIFAQMLCLSFPLRDTLEILNTYETLLSNDAGS